MRRAVMFAFRYCSRKFAALTRRMWQTKQITGGDSKNTGFGTMSMTDRRSSQQNTSSTSSSSDELNSDERLSCCNPSSRTHRFTILILMCFLSMGNDYCADIPAALQDHIQADLNVNNTKYSLLNSIGSWPNIVLCLMGGAIIDRWLGVRRGAFIFAVIIFCGHLIFTIGCFSHSFTVVVVGRLILGVGSDSLSFCREVYCVKWFLKRGQYNFAFALSFTISRLGSTLSLWLNPALYEKMNNHSSALGYTVAFGLISCAVSIYVSIQLGWLDRRAERIYKNSLLHRSNSLNSVRAREDAMLIVISDDHVVKLRDLLRLPLSLWLLCGMCCCYYCAVMPFVGQSNLFFQRKYDYDSRSATQCTSLIYFLAAGASPVAGILIDRTGRNLIWMVAGCVGAIASMLLLTFTFISPYLMMVLCGLALTMFAGAFWSAIAYTVPYTQLATSYGLVTSTLNLGLSLTNMAAGSLVDNYGYMAMLILFTASSCASLFFAVLLLFVDVRRNGTAVNASSKNRKAAIIKKEEEEQEAKMLPAIGVDGSNTTDSSDDAESATCGVRPEKRASLKASNLGFDVHEE